MYRRIAVPVDGSSFAEHALPLAVRMARRSGAELRLVTVCEPSGARPADAQEYLARLAARLADEHDGEISTAVRTGDVVSALLHEVEEAGADATVMATHGRGGLSRAWLGSVASGFLHGTTDPLLLVRPRAVEESGPTVHWGFAKLLVPLDGTELSERVLGYATGFGEMFDAAYHLTRIVTPPLDTASPYAPVGVPASPHPLESAVEAARAYLREHADRLRGRGLEVTTSVGVGAQAGRAILEEADSAGCDSIAMATHGRVGLSRAFLGSAADKVLRGADVPVLLYHVTEDGPTEV